MHARDGSSAHPLLLDVPQSVLAIGGLEKQASSPQKKQAV